VKSNNPIEGDNFWEAAIEGLELQRKRLEDQIRFAQSMVGSSSRRGSVPIPEEKPAKRNLSADARKRIGDAQRRRHAANREAKNAKK
jgi:hypothetical protein